MDAPWYIAPSHDDIFARELPTEQITSDGLEMCRHDARFTPVDQFRDAVRAQLSGTAS